MVTWLWGVNRLNRYPHVVHGAYVANLDGMMCDLMWLFSLAISDCNGCVSMWCCIRAVSLLFSEMSKTFLCMRAVFCFAVLCAYQLRRRMLNVRPGCQRIIPAKWFVVLIMI